MEMELWSRRKASRDFNVFQETNINLAIIQTLCVLILKDFSENISIKKQCQTLSNCH